MELCLGTVQFGMDYGVRGKKKPDLDESLSMMDYAVQNGIRSFDTACAYGTAEEITGIFLQRHLSDRNKLFITSKLLPNILEDTPEEKYYVTIRQNLQSSLRRLHTDYLDGYYFHTPAYVFQEAAVSALSQLKKEGSIRNAGVSVYEISEAEAGISEERIDLIQAPFSIFDQRMLNAGVFSHASETGTKVHTRSAFIQGLIFMRPDEVPPYLQKAAPLLREVEEITEKYRVSRTELAIGFLKKQTSIDRLVFGVHNLTQLKENISVFQAVDQLDAIEEAGELFQNLDAEIVMPSLWKKR